MFIYLKIDEIISKFQLPSLKQSNGPKLGIKVFYVFRLIKIDWPLANSTDSNIVENHQLSM